MSILNYKFHFYMNKIKASKPLLLVVGISVVVLIIVGLMLVRRTKSTDNSGVQPSQSASPEAIPTVDASVKVNLKRSSGGKDVVLSIDGIPSGTQSIDYELSYQTEKQGLQGVIGTIKSNSESTYLKTLTLGTCSSGACVYHEVVGAVKLNLKFSGGYGERLFEKEFTL